MYIMPSTPLTCCSMGAATVSATTLALAPGYDAETSTVGGAISGYWATGKVNRAMLPASTITMDRTEAKIGRLMKKRENTVRASFAQQGIGATVRRRCGAVGNHFPPVGRQPLAFRGGELSVECGRAVANHD